MGAAIITLAGLTGVAAMLIVGGQHLAISGGQATAIASPTSPLDEAERILARRYAKGEIAPDEYSRMLSILRR